MTGSGARFFADLLLGYDSIAPVRRAEIVRYLQGVVQARGIPLHVTNLWNALYFAFDLEDKAYFGAGINPDALPIRQMHRQDAALPVGAFVRVVAGAKELWAEVVYKEGCHPDLALAGGELFRQVDPKVSGASAPTSMIDGRSASVVQESLVLDVDAFGKGLNELREPQYRRLLRKQKWLDGLGHLVFEAVYEPPSAAGDDDTTAYARYLFDHHREGQLSTFLAVFLGHRATDPEAWAILLRSFDTTARLAESCSDLLSWRGYFFDRAAYEAQVNDGGADAFLGRDDLERLCRELHVSPGRIGYRAMRHELLRFAPSGEANAARRTMFEGTAYARLVCWANRWVADRCTSTKKAATAADVVETQEIGEPDLAALIDRTAKSLVPHVTDVGDLYRWLRPRLAQQMQRYFSVRDISQRRRSAVRKIPTGDRTALADPLQTFEDEPDAQRLTGGDAALKRAARVLVGRLAKDSETAAAIPAVVTGVSERAAQLYRDRDRSLVAHLRIDDDWQSGGIWRVEKVSADSSLLLLSPTMPLGLGSASAGPKDIDRVETFSLEPIVSSQTGWRVALTVRDLSLGELRLPATAADALGGEALMARIRHGEAPAEPCDVLFDAARRVLIGIRWPLDAVPGMYVRCNLERRGEVISIRSEPLVPPREIDGVLVHYEVDESYFRKERSRTSIDPATRDRAGSVRELVLAAFRSTAARPDGSFVLSLGEVIAMVLGSEFTPTDAGPVIRALTSLNLDREGDAYVWRPRVTRATRAVDRSLLEEFGLTPERTRQLVRRVVPMHIRHYRRRRPSAEKIASYAAARSASGNASLPVALPPEHSWVVEYEIGAPPQEALATD